MSIYATLWSLQFPRYGDDYVGCEWISVTTLSRNWFKSFQPFNRSAPFKTFNTTQTPLEPNEVAR
jgi:hypothetical protein